MTSSSSSTRRSSRIIAAFFLAVRQEKIDPDEIIAMIQEEQKHPQAVVTEEGKIDGLFNRFITSARGIASGHRAERDAGQLHAQLRQVLPPDPGR